VFGGQGDLRQQLELLVGPRLGDPDRVVPKILRQLDGAQDGLTVVVLPERTTPIRLLMGSLLAGMVGPAFGFAPVESRGAGGRRRCNGDSPLRVPPVQGTVPLPLRGGLKAYKFAAPRSRVDAGPDGRPQQA